MNSNVKIVHFIMKYCNTAVFTTDIYEENVLAYNKILKLQAFVNCPSIEVSLIYNDVVIIYLYIVSVI